jgi:hypothetical protein
MSERLGLVELAPPRNPYLGAPDVDAARQYSETTAATIDAEVQRIMDESHEQALRLLRAHRRELDALAVALLEHETLDEAEILAATGLSRAPALETADASPSHRELSCRCRCLSSRCVAAHPVDVTVVATPRNWAALLILVLVTAVLFALTPFLAGLLGAVALYVVVKNLTSGSSRGCARG